MSHIIELEVARAVHPGAASNAADANVRPTRVRVVLYDPLADAGLYDDWEGEYIDVPAETPASGVRCDLWMPRAVGAADQLREVTVADADQANADVILDEAGMALGSFVNVIFPEFRPHGDHPAHVSIHPDDDEGDGQEGDMTAGTRDAATGDVISDGEALDEPHPRDAFRCRAGGSYTIRIWLRPKCIVLHWSVGRYTSGLNSKAGRSYHFMVSYEDEVAHWLSGVSDTDPRFWRHNLRLAGVPSVPGVNDVSIAVNRNLGSGPRPRLWQGKSAPKPRGYAGHAGEFNTGTVGVSAEGMLGGKKNGLIVGTYAITDAQVSELIARVAALCRAWKIDATSAHEVCTHYEVNRLHRNMDPPGKWDITWLPAGFQAAYELVYGQMLCTTPVPAGTAPAADQQYRYRRYVDVPLDGTFTHDNTDRVSGYLRELIDRQV